MTKRTHEDMDYPEMDYFLNEDLSDVVFVVDGHRVPAIKSILNLKSRVFRAMFSGNFSESKESKESKLPEIEIKDTTFDAFKTLIRFIYSDELVFNEEYDWTHISDVYQLADRYDVLKLRQRIVQHLEPRIMFKHLKDLLPITRIVFIHNIEELIPKLMALITRKFHDLGRSRINELKELNDSIDDKVLDALTKKLLELSGFEEKPTYIKTLKTFIRFYYFDKLSLKDDEDLELIREVCRLCYFQSDCHLEDSVPLGNDRKPSWKFYITNYLKKRLTVETLEQISGIASDYKINGLIEKVNKMNASLN